MFEAVGKALAHGAQRDRVEPAAFPAHGVLEHAAAATQSAEKVLLGDDGAIEPHASPRRIADPRLGRPWLDRNALRGARHDEAADAEHSGGLARARQNDEQIRDRRVRDPNLFAADRKAVRGFRRLRLHGIGVGAGLDFRDRQGSDARAVRHRGQPLRPLRLGADRRHGNCHGKLVHAQAEQKTQIGACCRHRFKHAHAVAERQAAAADLF